VAATRAGPFHLLTCRCSAVAPASAPATTGADAEDDDDDVDLFGSDDEVDEEAERIKAERVAAYQQKKSAKGPGPAAKSIVTLDVKPWDDETDMAQLEANLRTIEQDGLVWGASTLVPVGYGVKKLQITIVVEDEKVSLDDLQEKIAEDEDHVQSTDIAAMAKVRRCSCPADVPSADLTASYRSKSLCL
jgi:elongation factor 1-beta